MHNSNLHTHTMLDVQQPDYEPTEEEKTNAIIEYFQNIITIIGAAALLVVLAHMLGLPSPLSSPEADTTLSVDQIQTARREVQNCMMTVPSQSDRAAIADCWQKIEDQLTS